ncbi:MAG: hypothetical protein N4A59_06990 [Marinifilum sp.]|jgi:dienelactone hydrolase|nr:hypothetical protein [Marinifilum sp.]MCT4644644.1 hypothetical protein [Carboxylicivirga sp.]
MNKIKRIVILISFCLVYFAGSSQINELKQWLATPEKDRSYLNNEDFAQKALSKKEAEMVIKLILADKQTRMKNHYEGQWDERELVFQDHRMPFSYNIFGEEPADGRSLFISLHGGGGAPAEVNDQQYKNQIHLYDKTMKDMEGVYLAMRAPTNTWNMWHQDDIDDFINIIIQMAVIKEKVNPNKVYLLGYSAGGDGLYQLAPRMADRLAAASMMAGHPGDASPLNLRNLPFALHMGAEDGAYDRNKWAVKWKGMLDSLEQANPGFYKHQVGIHEGHGHWMKLKDAVALPWMAEFKRNPLPQKIVWRQDNRHHEQFYWLWNHNHQSRAGGEIIASYDSKSNTVNVSKSYTNHVQVYLNDQMLNLNKPVRIVYNGKEVQRKKLARNISNIYESLNYKGDPNLAFSAKVELKLDI